MSHRAGEGEQVIEKSRRGKETQNCLFQLVGEHGAMIHISGFNKMFKCNMLFLSSVFLWLLSDKTSLQ